MPPPNPQEDRLNKLAAIAQIYGHLSGPQFQQQQQQDQQQQQRQMLALHLLGLQQQQQTQQADLAQRQAALAQTGAHEQGVLDLTRQDFNAREADRVSAGQARDQDRQTSANLQAYRDWSAANQMASPNEKAAMNNALLTATPQLKQAHDAFLQNIIQQDVPGAQQAYANSVAILPPGQARDASWTMQAAQHPALTSNLIDWSDPKAAMYKQAAPPPSAAYSGPPLLPNNIPTDLLPQVTAAHQQLLDQYNQDQQAQQTQNAQAATAQQRNTILDYLTKSSPAYQQQQMTNQLSPFGKF